MPSDFVDATDEEELLVLPGELEARIWSQTGSSGKRSINCWSTARDLGSEKRRYLRDQGSSGCADLFRVLGLADG